LFILLTSHLMILFPALRFFLNLARLWQSHVATRVLFSAQSRREPFSWLHEQSICQARDNASGMWFSSRLHVFHTDLEDACPFRFSGPAVLCWYYFLVPKDVSQSNFLF
jgi:hypothetical protein